jgi:hypothetical protein
MNRADGVSDMEGKAARVAASEWGQRASFNWKVRDSRKLSESSGRRYNLRLTQPPLQLMKRERHLGNIRVTDGIGRIACGWLNYCVLSRLRNNYDYTNQSITSHYECSC